MWLRGSGVRWNPNSFDRSCVCPFSSFFKSRDDAAAPAAAGIGAAPTTQRQSLELEKNDRNADQLSSAKYSYAFLAGVY